MYKSLHKYPIKPSNHEYTKIQNLKIFHKSLHDEFILTVWLQISRLTTVSDNPLLFYEVGKKESLFSTKVKVQMFLFP